MRLISARIRGFGRLVDTKINLDAKVIAIVGPNEAGKTTLLKALAHIDQQRVIPPAQRSRAGRVEDDTPVIELAYVLEDIDRDAVADLDLEAAPQRMAVSRSASGLILTIELEPAPRKSLASLRSAAKTLGSISPTKVAKWIEFAEMDVDDAEQDPLRDVGSCLSRIAGALRTLLDGGSSAVDAQAVELAVLLLSASRDIPVSSRYREALASVIEWAERTDPADEAQDRLWNRSHDLVLFDEPDRVIQSSYQLDDQLVQSAPKGLANLLLAAGLDLGSLHTCTANGDVARRDTALTQANAQLDEIFARAWNQSRLSVRLSVDGTLLRVAVWEDGNHITVFDERSAGLRMFVALVVFLLVRRSEHGRRPVLLIDEAENHLHIDAQADLVTMFIQQEAAAKVIYTTHSPACLPPDLGSGVRSVVPDPTNRQVSEVKNSFWHNTAGFSPLLLAMGAGAAAFTPARCVVLAEGATEMVLLPSLLRAATGIDALPYQVAPGLSETPKHLYPELDLEAARVAYLVDADAAGARLAQSLRAQGIAERLVVTVGVPGVENLLDQSAYLAAVAALLKECNPTNQSCPELPELPEAGAESWAAYLDRWAVGHDLRSPSKVAIASRLVEDEQAIPSARGKKHLQAAHRQILTALRL